MRLFELLALLVVALQLRALFPLPVTLRWSSGWAVLTISCRCLCGCESSCRRRSTTCDPSTGRRIGVMLGLVGTLVAIAWRPSAVLDNRSYLWWRTTWTSTVRCERSGSCLTRWSGQSSRWWWWRRWDTSRASMWTVVGVRDTVWLLGLLRRLRLVERRRWLLCLSRLRGKLGWLRVIRAGSHMVRFWRG